MSYINSNLIEELEVLKLEWKYNEAMKIVNSMLVSNPDNEEALLQVADIYYRSWELDKADKAIDYINFRKNNQDPMWLYIKGILEMEKNNRDNARKLFEKANTFTNAENHEILRCYGLCEYWYGNREKGMVLLKDSFTINNLDAEVIINLIQVSILEKHYKEANKYIKHYKKNKDNLLVVEKSIEYYNDKVSMFEEFIKIKDIF